MANITKDAVQARRIVRAFTQSIPAVPDEVFVRLCPVHEKAWLDEWDYDMVYSQSGFAEPGCVFTTNDGSRETVWVITHRDPRTHEIHFARFTIGLAATTLAVQVEPDGDEGSKVRIVYTHTSLSDEGDAFLETITEEVFNQMMRFWEASMTHYLVTGQKLTKAAFARGAPAIAANG